MVIIISFLVIIMNRDELEKAKNDFTDSVLGEGNTSQTIDGVLLYRGILHISFCYRNARGMVLPDNGYNGGDSYYLLARISPDFSQDGKYHISCEPNVQAIAAAVKESWNKFIN